MAATRKTEEEITPEVLGREGETCAQCGTKLAVDQRYCLNCGTPRAEPRLDYERALAGGNAGGAEGKRSNSTMQWSPLLAIVAIAILGVMLLLGVLIGQDDPEVTVTQVPATDATSTSATAPTTTTSPTTTSTTPTTTPTTTTPLDTNGTKTTPNGAGGIVPND